MPPNIHVMYGAIANERDGEREREKLRERKYVCERKACERKEINRANMQGRNGRVRMCRMPYKEKSR